MILGLGTDIVEVQRFHQVLTRHGERILDKLFTPEERQSCLDAPHRLAARFAAKEAFLKALGTGLRGMAWREISVVNDELGAPVLRCTGRAQSALQSLGAARVHVSLSHSRYYAVAQVILEG